MTNQSICILGTAAALCLIWVNAAIAGPSLEDLRQQGIARYRDGNYSEAERILRECLAISEHQLPEGSPEIARTANDLAASLQYQSRFTEAEPLYRRALAVFSIEPKFASDYAATLVNLASMYREQRRLTEAGELYKKAFALIDQSAGLDPLTIAGLMNDYGMFLKVQGDWDGAEHALERAAAIREKQLAPGSPLVIASWTSLADLYNARRDHDRAQSLFAQSVSACDHYSVAERYCGAAYNGLALSLERRGLVDEAERMLKRAAEIFERTYGPGHPRVAAVMNNLGTLSERKGDCKKSEKYLLRALDIWTKAYGPDHPDVASTYANLATTYAHAKHFDQAESFYQRALAVDEKTLGPDHNKVAVDLNNLGVLYNRMKRFDESDRCFERAIAVYGKSGNRDSVAAASVMLNLAGSLGARKQYENAAGLYQRALDIYQTHPGSETVAAATAFEYYAQMMRKQEQFAEAQKAEAFVMRVRVHNTIENGRLQSSFN